MSLGRGTALPFQVVGHPSYPDTGFAFLPLPSAISKEPRYVNLKCYGLDLRNEEYITRHPCRLNLQWLMTVHRKMNHPAFFEINFNYHAGNEELQDQVKNAVSETDIRKSWEPKLKAFKSIRKKYLLYTDLE
jgi:hypothetical protein